MPVDQARLTAAYHAALQRPPEARDAFIADVSAGDRDFLVELTARVRTHDASAGPLDPDLTLWPHAAPAEPTPFPADPRFRLLRRIGEGSMGVVYLAEDRAHGAQVALKTIARMSAGSLLRFKTEFRALADVAHPNLVRLYELLCDQSLWFFTMEFVDGESFLGRVRPSDRLDLAKLRDTLPQLIDAVAAIHAAGKLHCDLKPSNVIVSHDGRLVVLDFGLVTEIDAPDTAVGQRTVAGTIAYMSPEQARAERLTEASDWYGVGAMLYQALTGRVPIDGADVSATLTLKQINDPEDPHTIDPLVPADLSRLCMALLRRDPRDRPSRSDILGCLARTPSEPSERQTSFVGRERQLQRLHDAMSGVRTGGQRSIYVHGSSGVGKSALVDRFLKDVGGDAVVLKGRCYERESVPFKALDAIIDDLAGRLRAWPEAADLLTDDAHCLARLFPVLTQVPAIQDLVLRRPAVSDLQEVRRRAAACLRELLQRLASRHQLIVAIDDLQWSDLDSAALLQALLSPPDAPPLLLVGSYRSEYADSEILRGLLGGDARVEQLHLTTLDEHDATALARNRLGDRATDTTIAAIVREAGGVPLFVEQLVQAAGQARDPELAVPLTLDDVLQQRFGRLDESSRRLLEHVVVGGQPLPLGAILQSAGITPEQALRDLATLRVQQWVRTQGTGQEQLIEPFHDRIRVGISGALDPAVLRGHHLELARALEPMAVDPAILALHYSEAGRMDEAVRHATMAAGRAAQTLAFDRAARLYAMAVEWQRPDSGASHALLIELARALTHAGRSNEAGDAYMRAAEGRPESERFEYHQRAAEQYLNHGHVEKGYAVLRELLHGVGLRMPKQGTPAVVALAVQRLRLRVSALWPIKRTSPMTEAAARRLEVCLLVGRGLSMIEPVRGAGFQTRACRLALRTGEPRRVAMALSLEAALEASAGHKSKARVDSLLDRSEQLAHQLDDLPVLAYSRFLRGVTHYLRADWSTSLEYCREAETLLRERCVNVWWEIDQSASFAIWNLCYLGRMAEAAARVAPLLKEASDRGDRLLRSQLLSGISVLIPLAQNTEPEAVREELLSAVQPFRGEGYHMPHLLQLLGLCEIDLYLGNGSDAHDRIESEYPRVAASLLLEVEFIRIEVLGLRARCAIAAAKCAAHPAPLLAAARRYARMLERVGSAWARAYAEPVYAQLALAEHAESAALRRLRSSVDQFERLDMSLRAAAAAYRMSGVMGGTTGAAARHAAITRMRELGVHDTEAVARVFMPLEAMSRGRS